MTASHTNRSARGLGFGLVELMVALTISLLIMAGVGIIFVNTKKTYNVQDRLTRVQENGRFAMHYLMRDLRMAGYLGCFSDIDSFNNTLNGPTDFLYNATVPLEGLDGDSGATTWSPSGAGDLPANVVPNTDLVTVRLIDPSSSIQTSSPMPNSSAELNVTDTSGFEENEIIMISDCATGDLMQITGVQSSASKLQHAPSASPPPGNDTQKLQKAYDTNANVFKYATRRYYIRENPAGIASLYRDDNGQNPAELVEGVENLQVTYGVDTDNDGLPNRYYKAGEAGLQSSAEWANVVSIRFGVLVRSLNSLDTDKDTIQHNVNGTLIGPLNDNHQRRVFQATVLLRNVGQ